MRQYDGKFLSLIVELFVKVGRSYNLSYKLAFDMALDFIKELREYKDEGYCESDECQ